MPFLKSLHHTSDQSQPIGPFLLPQNCFGPATTVSIHAPFALASRASALQTNTLLSDAPGALPRQDPPPGVARWPDSPPGGARWPDSPLELRDDQRRPLEPRAEHPPPELRAARLAP
jgi:hypothetical protein